MKFPKSRANIFLVEREMLHNKVIVGAFSEWEDADDYRGSCLQEWYDQTGSTNGVDFRVVMTTFYG